MLYILCIIEFFNEALRFVIDVLAFLLVAAEIILFPVLLFLVFFMPLFTDIELAFLFIVRSTLLIVNLFLIALFDVRFLVGDLLLTS